MYQKPYYYGIFHKTLYMKRDTFCLAWATFTVA